MTHSPHFLRLLQLDPYISIVFAGVNGLRLLSESKYVIVDGTFDLVEEKLVLTTLMAYYDGIALPSAYFLSERKTQESYLQFFQVKCTSFLYCISNSVLENQRTHQWTNGPHRVFVGFRGGHGECVAASISKMCHHEGFLSFSTGQHKEDGHQWTRRLEARNCARHQGDVVC